MSEPDDMGARVGLAWCLFMQALHQAGRENLLTALVTKEEEREEPVSAILQSVLNTESLDLLKGCLQQAITVRQLSPREEERREVEKLQELAKLAGAEQEVREAEVEGLKILMELTQAVINQPQAVVTHIEDAPKKRKSPRNPPQP
jgi:hypothetical protein